jgi:hypothetical protein
MRVTPAVQITDAMIVASSVVEVPPAGYLGGTSYAIADRVAVGVVGGALAVYESLQAANVGHAPAASPTWWRHICDTYGVYRADVTYSKNARVIDPVAHLVYESQLDNNLAQPLATGTAWLKVGATNVWAAFDRLRNTQTVAPVDITVSIAPGQRVGAIAVIGMDAANVAIDVAVAGVEVYRREVSLKLRRSFGWRDYLLGAFSFRKSVQFYDLPPYRNAVITVSVSKAKGQRGIGGIIIGNAVYIGDMQYKARSDHLNFSQIERDDFGNIELQPRRSVPKFNGEVWFDKALTRRVTEVREATNGVPAIWSGLDDFTLDYFEPLFLWGIPKEFSISLEDTSHGTITLEVEEL